MEMKKTNIQKQRTTNIISLIIVFLMMASAAFIHNGSIFGHQLKKTTIAGISEHGDTTLINTTEICPQITGYGGPVPVEIALVDGKIVYVRPLANAETQNFFKRVTDSGLTESWNGLTAKEASEKEVDAVTGATYSSTALIGNVRAGVAALLGEKVESTATPAVKTKSHDDGSVKASEATEVKAEQKSAAEEKKPTEPVAKENAPRKENHKADTTTINTTEAGSSVMGYNGPVPVEITITDGKITGVEPLENSETPGFFKRVTDSGLLESWNGLTPEEAKEKEVDAVTGATYSSTAIIENVRLGLANYKPAKEKPAKTETTPKPEKEEQTVPAKETAPSVSAPDTTPSAQQVMAEEPDTEAGEATGTALDNGHKEQSANIEFYAVLAVLIAAMSVPLFFKNKKYRTVQQLLNVGVLGFWSGTFLNYTLMLRVMGSGLEMTFTAAAIPLLLLTAAFIYPLFGKKGYYCAWVCPLGSLQELASKCNPHHRLTMSAKTVKALNTFRQILWGCLMLCLWTGLWMSWIDYELFTAFLVEQASIGILIAGGAIIILSIWIPRPYCRFVCPTGTLMKIGESV